MKRRATVLISLGATSNAAGATEGPRIVYRGPAVCPDGIAFVERVRSRTPHAIDCTTQITNIWALQQRGVDVKQDCQP